MTTSTPPQVGVASERRVALSFADVAPYGLRCQGSWRKIAREELTLIASEDHRAREAA